MATRNHGASQSFDMERFLKALADPTRLRILNLLRQDEICVCYFVEVLDEIQPKISRHLAYLRSSGLVTARRDGKWIHYRIADLRNASAARMLKDLFAWMDEQPRMRADRAKLKTACCSPNQFVTLQGAPRPSAVQLAPR